MATSEYTVFEYLYRDAGNFKAWGSILLEGTMSVEDERELRECFVDGMYFDAEKLGMRSLRERLWAASASGYSVELDHEWHEFSDMWIASPDEIAQLSVWGSVGRLLSRAKSAANPVST